MTPDEQSAAVPSGVIVRALATAFQLDLKRRLDPAAQKAAVRFFEGQQVGIPLVQSILTAVAEGLLETGLIPRSIIEAVDRDLTDLPVAADGSKATVTRILDLQQIARIATMDAVQNDCPPVIRRSRPTVKVPHSGPRRDPHAREGWSTHQARLTSGGRGKGARRAWGPFIVANDAVPASSATLPVVAHADANETEGEVARGIFGTRSGVDSAAAPTAPARPCRSSRAAASAA